MAGGVVIGPMFTGFGLRSWFWACRPSMLVAVPGGFWVAIQAASVTGGFGGVVGGLAQAPGLKQGGKLVERLESAPDEELPALAGVVVYRVADLASIECQRVMLGTNPDLIVCTRGGGRTKYGLANAVAFDAVVDALRDAYGDLVQRP